MTQRAAASEGSPMRGRRKAAYRDNSLERAQARTPNEKTTTGPATQQTTGEAAATVDDRNVEEAKMSDPMGRGDDEFSEVSDVSGPADDRNGVSFRAAPPRAQTSRASSSNHTEQTLLESMTEVMALSYLVFMYADLRALSATGRIATRFEHIAVESDYSPRYESDFLAGDRAAGTGKATARMVRAGAKGKTKDGGLSTAQIMAVMLLEIESSVSKKKRNEEGDIEGRGRLEPEKSDRKSMTKLLQVYASIIGADLNDQQERIEVSKSVKDLARSTVTAAEAPAATRGVQRRVSLAAAVETLMLRRRQARDGEEENDGADGSDSAGGNNAGENVSGDGDGGGGEVPAVPQEGEGDGDAEPSQSTLKRSVTNKAAAARARFTRSELMKKVKGQESAMHLDRLRDGADEDLNKITANIFSSAGADEAGIDRRDSLMQSESEAEEGDPTSSEKVAVTGEDMRKIMERAVKSRIYSKLDFMAKFFRRGTVSHLMALSEARVVWFNDWFPAKELTFGICVDETKSRVIIVFRGAITTKDWSKAADFKLATAPNPVPGASETVRLHHGFYSYLFRKRKDTNTTKYYQIAEVAHRIGAEHFGQDYNLMVCGHSLGAALSTVFSFWASADPRFTRNGPVRVFTFGSPYVGSHDFADSWRMQEETGKLRYARFYNHNDLVAYGPSSNLIPIDRGSQYRHVGLSIAIHPIQRRLRKGFKKTFEPDLYYVPEERAGKAYRRGLKNTVMLHIGIPWKIAGRHTLQEMIKRVADGKREEESSSGQKIVGNGFDLLGKSLDEIYDIEAGFRLPIFCVYRSVGIM